jgi:L-alanine-DL-glutamate epimerase-like enolase superfamily enzyme
MPIVTMDVFPIELTLREPIPMSNGVITSTGNVVVRLMDGDGTVGWGEGVEAPALTGQRQADIVADLERLRPLIIGSDPTRITETWARAQRLLPTGTTALAAIDIALHDLVARALGVPVHRLLGGAIRDRQKTLGTADREFKTPLGFAAKCGTGLLSAAESVVGCSGFSSVKLSCSTSWAFVDDAYGCRANRSFPWKP